MDGIKKSSLGKGLAALLGDERKDNTNKIDITKIEPGHSQPRGHFSVEKHEELKSSIKEKGVLQPLLVRKSGHDIYHIVAGERRWRAAKEVGLLEIPCVVLECDDREALEIGLVENLQRSDLNPIEEAKGYDRLIAEFSLTQEDVARSVGKSRSHVANSLRLLNLKEDVKEAIYEGKISAGHARALLTAQNQEELFRDVLNGGLSVRETEKRASKVRKEKAGTQYIGYMDTDIKIISKQIADALNMRVELVVAGQGGSITVKFQNYAQLDILISKLVGHYKI